MTRGKKTTMQRREARLRKEYLFRKSLEEKEQRSFENKQKLKEALDASAPLPHEVKKDALEISKKALYDDGLEGSLPEY